MRELQLSGHLLETETFERLFTALTTAANFISLMKSRFQYGQSYVDKNFGY